MGHLLGHAVRFGTARCDVMAAGEGIETMLSLRSALPTLPLAAALSAGHLAALLFPPGLRRLYIVRDNDPAGRRAEAALTARAQAERDRGADAGASVEATSTTICGSSARMRSPQRSAVQLAPEDVTRFWRPAARDGRIGQHGAGATAEGSGVSAA